MLNEIRRDLRVGLVAHFVAALVFLVFLEPIAHFVGELLKHAPAAAIRWYQDRMISEVAVGPFDYAFVALALAGMTPVFAGVGYLASSISHRRRHAKRATASVALSTDMKPLAAPAGVKPPRAPWMSPRSRVVVPALWVIACLLGVALAMDGYLRANIHTSFQQHVTILTPFIEPRERQLLLSQFASMRTRADYDAVVARVTSLAQEKGITLPANHLYPLPGE